MKNLKLCATLLVLACAFYSHGFDLAKWTTFTLRSKKPYSQDKKHEIELREGPKVDANTDATRVFCGVIDAENLNGRVTRDDTVSENGDAVQFVKPPCDPATCLTHCACKQPMVPSKKESLNDLLNRLNKLNTKESKKQSTCHGLCIFDASCTCGTVAARYNKSHPHIRLDAPKVDENGIITANVAVNMNVCKVQKDPHLPWVKIHCDNNTKMYELFRVGKIISGGSDVTKELEENYWKK